MITLRKEHGIETIVDITGLPKRMAIEIFFTCLKIDFSNIMFFELKKNIEVKTLTTDEIRIQKLYHSLEEGKDYEYVQIMKSASLTENTPHSILNFVTLATISTGLNLIIIFEIVIYRLPWQWLITHPNSYGLQAAIDLFLLLITISIFQPRWRKWCWVAGIIPVFLVMIQILGGPSK